MVCSCTLLKLEQKHQCDYTQRVQRNPTEELQSCPFVGVIIPGTDRAVGPRCLCSTPILGSLPLRKEGAGAIAVWLLHPELTFLGRELIVAVTQQHPLPHQWLVTNCV